MQMGGGGARGGAKENLILGLRQRHATAARRNLCKALQIFYLLVFCQSMFMMTNLQRLEHARQATMHVQTEETLKSKTPIPMD